MKNLVLIANRIALTVGVVFAFCLPLIVRQRQLNRFAWTTRFLGYDGKPPRYQGKKKYNKYLRRLRFHSRIPLVDWKQQKSTLEVFFLKKYMLSRRERL